MNNRKKVFAVVGSAGEASSNLRLVHYIATAAQDYFEVTVYDSLQRLPHFNPVLSTEAPPLIIQELRDKIAEADAVLICTPEYIFSLPSGLKNVFEWCVATTVFSGKPVGLITASAHGVKGHEELQRILKTIDARFTAETALLIQGIKGKIDAEGAISDGKTKTQLSAFLTALDSLIQTVSS